MKRLTTLLFFTLCLQTTMPAQVTLVRKGKPTARIVPSSDNRVDAEAARLLQDFVERITGARLPIQQTDRLKKNDVIIGNDGLNKDIGKEQLTEDGFRLMHTDHTLRIVSGGGRGSLYGVVSLLERYWGLLLGRKRIQPHPRFQPANTRS